MPIVDGDIRHRLSVLTGAAGNTVAQANPAASLGKYIATTDIASGLHNLFPKVSSAESGEGVTKYLCAFVYNAHGTLAFQDASIWIESQREGGADVSIGLDPAGVVAVGAAGAQAATIADLETAPAGVVFSLPTTEASALAIGDIPAGSCQAVWFRQVCAPDALARSADNVRYRVSGMTDA
jgi:hypothetical protein